MVLHGSIPNDNHCAVNPRRLLPKAWCLCVGLFQVFTCGDLCEITYNNYIHTKEELQVLQATLTGPQKAERAAMPLGAPWVGGYKYLPSEVMGLDASNEKVRTDKQADQACSCNNGKAVKSLPGTFAFTCAATPASWIRWKRMLPCHWLLPKGS